MKKKQLLNLTAEIRKITGDKVPIICGSQSFFAYQDFAPDIISRSIECDYLFPKLNREIRNRILEEYGLESDFRIENGYYADPLGLFTVVLPEGWQDRELYDDEGNIAAFCVEVYDTSVSKFIAGREKDFEFLEMLISNEIIDIEKFAERLKLLSNMPQMSVINSRTSAFQEYLSRSKTKISLNTLKTLIKNY